MVNAPITADMVNDAGIAASIAANANAIPEPSVYFQDFNFGKSMFDALQGNAEALAGLSDGVADVGTQNRIIQETNGKRTTELALDVQDMTDSLAEQRAELQKISVGGVELSLEEWDEIAEALDDPEKQQQLKDALMADGKTAAEADQIVYLTTMAARIAQKEGNGLPLTAEERAVQRRLENVPADRADVQTGVQTVQALNRQSRTQLTPAQVQNADTAQIDDTEIRQSIAVTVVEAADSATIAEASRGTSSVGDNPFADTRSPNSEFNAQAAGDIQLAEVTPLQATPTVSVPTLANG